jgi:Tol biopolymer transport system component
MVYNGFHMAKDYIDQILDTPNFYMAKVSPDLKYIAWSWSNIGPIGDIYIASIDKKEKPRKLTNFDYGTRILSWTPDSRYIIAAHDYDGDERYCLYKVDIETGDHEILTEEYPEYFSRGGQITPDNKYLIYGANFDFDLDKEIESTLVYRQDLNTGEKLKLAEPKKPAFLIPQLNKQGSHILYTRNDLHPKGEQVWMVDINGAEDKEILNFGPENKVSASWHTDGENIIFTAEFEKYRKVGIFNINSEEIKWLVDDSNRNIDFAYSPVGSNKVVINEIKEAQNTVSSIDIDSAEEEKISTLKFIFPFAQISENLWVSRYYNSSQPNDLVIHDNKEVIYSITDVFNRVEYTKDDLIKAENYTWKSVDDLEIQGWLYRAKKTYRYNCFGSWWPFIS